MSADLKAAFAELAKAPYNLLDAKGLDDFIASLRPRWVDYEANGRVFQSTDKSKAIIYRDNEAVTISAVGVVDGDNSQLGDYGNLWLPRGGRDFTPDLNDLGKARFVLNITYPRGEEETNVNKGFTEKASKQILALNKIQLAVNAALKKDSSLPAVPDDKISDWIDFEESGGGIHGSAKITIGNVYSQASRKLRGSEVTELSPRKAAQPAGKPRCDGLGFFDHGRIPKSNTLQAVESLPVFLADGSNAKARDAQDLSTLLYGGRWVRVDFQMIIWNIKNSKGNSRAFKLEAVRVSLLPAKTATNPNVKFLKPNSLNETDGEVPQSLVDAATNTNSKGSDTSETVSEDESNPNGKKDNANGKKRSASEAGLEGPAADSDGVGKKGKLE